MEGATLPRELPPPPRTRVVTGREEAERAVAAEIAALVRAGAGNGRPPVLGLATGGTMAGVYRELARLHREEGLSFAGVTTFNLDEYLGLAPGDPHRFAAEMRRALFEQVDLDPSRCFVPDGDLAGDALIGYGARWETRLASAGGIDLQLLGIGRNGHVAFNEPGSPADSRTRVVKLAPSTRADAARDFGDAGAVPQRAITAGLATIRAARRLRLLAFGAHKAAAVRAMLAGPVDPACPASLLRDHPDLEVWLDREAAAEVAELLEG